MIVEIIINRGTMTIESYLNFKSGTSSLLTAGSNKILFDSAFADANYDVSINCYSSGGVPSGYVLTLKEADGFTVDLPFDSIISYVANKT